MNINSLHEHNREAYLKVMQHFDEGHQKACVVHATGTGKSERRSIMAAMIDELSKGTRWRKDALECIKGCYPAYFEGKEPE